MGKALRKVDTEIDLPNAALVARSASSRSVGRESRISRSYHFESAHHLPLVPDGHKCKNMHGHNYRVEIVMQGELDSRGFIKDFAEIDDLVLPLIKKIDHRVLNDIEVWKIRRLKTLQLGFFNASLPAKKSVSTKTIIVGLKHRGSVQIEFGSSGKDSARKPELMNSDVSKPRLRHTREALQTISDIKGEGLCQDFPTESRLPKK